MHLLIGIVQCNLVQVALSMLRDEGIASFYYGLGPSLVGIAPYIAVNFCIFDLWVFQTFFLSVLSTCTETKFEPGLILFWQQGEEVFTGGI
jgi:hypothetical protein